MKIIDLLNMIANGKEVIIKDGINKYHYSKVENDYITGMGYDYEHYFSSISNILDYLNDEVEIIEDTPNGIRKSIGLSPKEDKKIEKIKDYSIITTMGLDSELQEIKISKDIKLEEVVDKINEIIDKINGE